MQLIYAAHVWILNTISEHVKELVAWQPMLHTTGGGKSSR